MLDLSVAYSRYRFLGDEFLSWLWYIIENDPSLLKQLDPDCVSLEIGNRIVLENRSGKSVERISINGDDAGLEEGRIALRKGALVTEMSLVIKTSELQWSFSVKGESLNLSNIKTPGPNLPQSAEEIENFLSEKTDFYIKLFEFIDKIFGYFVKKRISPTWGSKHLPGIKKWIKSAEDH
jgi:hypothetical protein